MKTDQLERATRTDHRGDHGPREVPRADAPSPRPPTGGTIRRLALGVAAVLLTAVIAAGAWFVMTPSIDEPSVQSAPLFDLSIRAHDHDAATRPDDSLLQQSIRARALIRLRHRAPRAVPAGRSAVGHPSTLRVQMGTGPTRGSRGCSTYDWAAPACRCPGSAWA